MRQNESAKASQLFVELLRLSLAPQRGQMLSRAPTDCEWRKLFDECKRHSLVGMMYEAVACLPPVQRPPRDVLLPWYALTERIKQQNALLNVEAVRVCTQLEHDGLPNVLLKGQGVALLYPHPELRMPGDIDLWIAVERSAIMRYVHSNGWHVHTTLLHTEFLMSGVTEVEAHFMPSCRYNPLKHWQMCRLFESIEDVQLQHKVSLESGGNTLVSVPTAAFNRVYLLAHIYRHFFGEGIGLRQLVDYYYCLRQGFSAAEAEQTVCWLKKIGMYRFARAMMYVMRTLLQLPDQYSYAMPDARLGKMLLREVMLAGNFGQHDQRYAQLNSSNRLARFWTKTRRNVSFVCYYPGEVLFDVPFRVWHYAWRKLHGYL